MLNKDTTTLTTIDFSRVDNAHSILKILTNPKTRFTIHSLVNTPTPVTAPVSKYNGRIWVKPPPMRKVNGRYPNTVDTAYGYQIRKELLNRNLIIEETPKDKRQKSYSVNNTLIDKITDLSKRLMIAVSSNTSISQEEQDLDNTAKEKAKKVVSAINNDKRQDIINLLHTFENMSVTDIELKLKESTGLTTGQPVISGHLTKLRKANLVTYESKGKIHFYSLNREAIEMLLNFIFEITNSERAFKEENELEKLPPNLSPLSPLK